VNAGFLHQAMYPPARTGMIAPEDMIQAIQAQRRILFVQSDDLPKENLVAPLPLGYGPGQPSIKPASGNPKQPAHFLHRDEAAVFRDELELVLYGLENMPTDFFSTSMVSSFSARVFFRALTSASSSRTLE
jgi:hypothetical protein